MWLKSVWFQWAPTLGGECYVKSGHWYVQYGGHVFQWAPTLGGECYWRGSLRCGWRLSLWVSMGTHPWGRMLLMTIQQIVKRLKAFQWAPTLGGECYLDGSTVIDAVHAWFQWAPTLEGECYSKPSRTSSRCLRASFNGHPPLGVNATYQVVGSIECDQWVSMGTHP